MALGVYDNEEGSNDPDDADDPLNIHEDATTEANTEEEKEISRLRRVREQRYEIMNEALVVASRRVCHTMSSAKKRTTFQEPTVDLPCTPAGGSQVLR